MVKLNSSVLSQWLVICVSFLIIAALPVSAQDGTEMVQGIQPSAFYHIFDFDSVSIPSQFLYVDIPLLSYPQRGHMPNIELFLNAKTNSWHSVRYSGGSQHWQLNNGSGGVFPSLGPFPQTMSYYNATYKAHALHAVDATGAHHIMGSTTSSSMESVDGSGFNFTNNVLIDRNGVQYNDHNNYSVPLAQDPSGNQVTWTTDGTQLIDTLGRHIPWVTNQQIVPGCYSYNFPTFNGGTVPVTFCYASYTATSNFQISGIQEGTARLILLYEVDLPNGTKWRFSYNSWGDLASINLPTGGTVSYSWTYSATCAAAIPNSITYSRVVLTRSIDANDGSGPKKWTYPSTINFNNPSVVTDPAGNDTAYTIGYGCPGYVTEEKYYSGSQGSGTLLKTVDTNWSIGQENPFAYIDYSVVPYSATRLSTITKWPTGQQSEVDYTYDSGHTFYNINNGQSPTWPFSYGTLIMKQEYDYGSGARGPQLRQTTTSYMALNPSAPNQSSYFANNLVALPFSVQVADGSGIQRAYTTYGYDETALQPSGVTQQHVAGEAYPGNETSVHRWLNGSATATTNCPTSINNGYAASYKTYFDTGTRYQFTDSCGTKAGDPSHTTTYAYSSSYFGAYPTTISNALGQAVTYGYDFNTGLVTSVTDLNRQNTTKTYDLMGRLTHVSYPDGGATSYCYTDMGGSTCSKSGAPYEVVATKAITSSLNETSTVVFDGLGRISQTQLNSDPSGTTYTQTAYDALGRKHQVHNPTRCNPPTTNCGETTWGYTTTNYDPLSRVTSVTEQDGSTVSTNYSAFPCTTVTDEAGKARKSCMDGLGRMTGVWEDPSGLNYETDYQYDALNDLTNVTQKGSNASNPRTRTFQYDSLSELISAANPESGTITYAYDADGNVITKTAPLPNQTGAATVTTSYSYDALNRLTARTYSDGTTPAAYFQYDTAENWGNPPFPQYNIIGRLTGSSVLSGSQTLVAEIFSYDTVGRVLVNPQCSPATCGTSSFMVYNTYDLSGNLSSITTAAGTVVSYGPYSGANRLTTITSSLSDAQHPPTLYSVDASLGYWPTGALRKALYGNGLTRTLAFNNRLQPCRINVNSAGGYFSQCTDAIPSGNVLDFTMGYNAGSADNGNIVSWTATGNQTFSRSYSFDSLNRIQSMSDTAASQTCKGLSWTIDAWSNMTAQTTTAGTCYSLSAAVNTNNQLQSGYSYDAAGNMTYDGFHHYGYDGENRIVQVDGGTTASYVYDANGRRVRKNTGSSFTEYSYGLNGSVQGEYNGSSWPRQYVYSGNDLIAEYTSSTTQFIFGDHLGSTRLVTGVNQSIVDSMDYLPFGQEIAGASVTTHKFTGKERDSESGLDNFGARYNASSLGRFMSADPLWIKADRMIDPQRLNLYAYGRNNPLRFTDPTGMDVVMGKCSGGDAQKCFSTFLKGLNKDDRSHVHLVTGDDKNGFKKGQYGITVDAGYKSSSNNFSILQKAANDHSGVASLNVVTPKDSFESNVGVQKGTSVVLQSFKSIYGVDNYVSAKDAVPGQTLYQLFGDPLADTIYSPSNTQVYVANDQTDVEIVKTEYHELTHVVLGDFGRAVPNGREDVIKPQLNKAEQEAEQNFKQQ